MSIRLTVKMRGQAGGSEKPQVVMLDEDVVMLGRDNTCQVVLAQQAVSRNHARLSRDGSLYFVEDMGSSYGTNLNGQKLPKGEKRLLRNGDTIAIAQFDIVFDRVAAESKDESGNTMMVSRKVVKDVMKGLSAGEQPYFRLMNGPKEGQKIEIPDASELVIGRDDTADVVLVDDLVSRRHVKIRRDWSGTHVEDLGSRNGIKVNRKKTTRATLKDRDEVEVGGARLLYLDPSEVREAALVLPAEEEENTAAVKSDEVPGADEQPEAPPDDAPAEEPPPEEPPPEDEAPAPEDEPPADEPYNTTEEEPSWSGQGPADDAPPANRLPIDLGNKQNLIALGVVGVLGLMAIVVVILVLAGA